MNEQVILRRWTGKAPTERAQEYARYMAAPFVILGRSKERSDAAQTLGSMP